MLVLDGVSDLDIVDLESIREYTNIRFSHSFNYSMKEAFVLYEQSYISESEIRSLCEKSCGCELRTFCRTPIPSSIMDKFRNTSYVPVTYIPSKQKLIVIYLTGDKSNKPELIGYDVEYQQATIYDYVDAFNASYSLYPEWLKPLSAKIIIDMLVEEAIKRDAADMTISTLNNKCSVYFNIRKHKVSSRRVFDGDYMRDIITYLCSSNKYMFDSNSPHYVDVDLNKDYRGRVLINSKFKGFVITIRLLPNKAFSADVNTLGYSESSCDWLIKNIVTREKGIRLIVGETMSGKNTTALSLLKIYADTNKYKIVSVERNVEQELDGIEQINAITDDEFRENIETLIHQNPDFVYITEIRDAIALPIIRIANTGKCLLSTLHSNSVADTISRLVDITGLSSDRIVQSMHSIVYQELVRDDEADTVRPMCRYIKFTEDLKLSLYGKSLGEVYKIIKENERGDEW